MKEWGVSKLSGRHLHVYMYFFPSTHALSLMNTQPMRLFVRSNA